LRSFFGGDATSQVATPTPAVPTPARAEANGSSGFLRTAKNFIGDGLLGAGVLNEYNGWTKQEDESN
jgi:hypothetical protein